MTAGFESIDRMAFGGKLPWWDGTSQAPGGGSAYVPDLTPDAEGWETMRQKSGCGFHMGLVDVLAADTGERIPGQFTVRCSDGYLIPTCVGDKYHLLQTERLFSVMAGLGVKPHTAGTLMGRRKVWALGQLPGVTETKRREGDRTKSLPFIFGDSSNDGSSILTLGPTSIEVVCMNTRAAALGELRGELRKVTGKHTASLDAKLDTAAEVLGMMEQVFKKDAELLQQLADTPFSVPQMKVLACQLLSGKDDPKQAQEVVAQSEGRSRALYARKGSELVNLFTSGLGCRGNSALDAVNATTEYVDHARSRTGKVDWDTYGGSILWGAGAELKQRAVALVTA